ncbi:hypothetical protein LJY25_16305 [Hymenobacter sp. BT175]|uniref:hypothetical protein n=1 Tax=Hymenobacter translucens TaxID=2886507 RepID=UPI001D0DF7B0|nr:hypothetical protein [Hymenobacter translucens]MCC2548012.1 hypothetical protein [Hymenobacter translucens]
MKIRFLLPALLSALPFVSPAQDTRPELNTQPQPTAPAPRQLNTLPAVPDSVREQQQQQRQAVAPPAETTRYAVGLKNGKSFRALDVEVKQPFLGRSYLLLDGQQRFDLSEVSFYEDETGHYVRTALPGSSRETTLRRDRVGRISLYSVTSTQYNNNSPFGYGGYGRYGGYPYGGFGPTYRTVKTEYFSKNNGPIQDLSVKNLAVATSDNPTSSALLAESRKYQRYSTISYVAAGGMMAYGLLATLNPNQRGVSPLVYAGLPLFIVPVVMQSKVQNNIKQAILQYNR